MTETKELILNALAEIMREVPEQRFGQVLYNYITCKYISCDTFYADDEVILTDLENIVKNFEKQRKNIDNN